jgi:hypothetical protein
MERYPVRLSELEDESDAAVVPSLEDWEQRRAISARLSLAAMPDAIPAEGPAAHRICDSDEEFWWALRSEFARPRQSVRLDRFSVVEWFPQSPGLYHTPDGNLCRQYAEGFVLDRADVHTLLPSVTSEQSDRRLALFGPQEKFSMISGGVGSLRLRPRAMGTEERWFMCATSSRYADMGIPIALTNDQYADVIGPISETGHAVAIVEGELVFVPRDLATLYREYEHVPQLCVAVERLTIVNPKERSCPRVSVPVLFTATIDGRHGLHASFVSFNPARPNGIIEAAEWVDDVYVNGLYHGRIVSDFDEQVHRFAGAVFSLNNVMSGSISSQDVHELSDTIGPFGSCADLLDHHPLPRRIRRDSSKGQIFISYAHSDRQRVLEVVERLQSSGFSTWIDRSLSPGERWDQSIARALRSSAAVLVFLSPASVTSLEVASEIALAAADAIPITPILLADCKIPARLELIHAVDLREADDESRLEGLVLTLRRSLE